MGGESRILQVNCCWYSCGGYCTFCEVFCLIFFFRRHICDESAFLTPILLSDAFRSRWRKWRTEKKINYLARARESFLKHRIEIASRAPLFEKKPLYNWIIIRYRRHYLDRMPLGQRLSTLLLHHYYARPKNFIALNCLHYSVRSCRREICRVF